MQKAWKHDCDPYPVEVELEGQWTHAPQTQLSRASFYYWQGNVRSKAFEYTLTRRGEALGGWNFNLQTDLDIVILKETSPLLKQISYDLARGTISGNCTTEANLATDETIFCLQGSVDEGEILSFDLNDTRTNTVSHLRASKKRWSFNHYPPIVDLRRVNADNESLGDTVLKTTVTKPGGHCNSLKICVATASSIEMIVSIGVILRKLDPYGIYCTK
jgi:hypothetical protein